MKHTINVAIELEIQRCGKCGQYYGTEGFTDCPHCQKKEIWRLNDLLDDQSQVKHLNSVIGGLRGALKRARGR